ncbi:Acetylglucosaminyltransferase EXT1/exostosin 1 [Handroanthus impetiginosus]|uniref:Acetylglucosaminyltransferase EXT1/exostosin 1 n=1 Tax=Handroanthus impetiginosus TaxID=429701 RepID=A0A2G9I8N2_9LAMI|nr:Acetylglucosaminyltransferase EXT1/exostosin 1 [Handroanthus impetiginosus]
MQKSINRTLVCLSLCIPLLVGSVLLAGTLDYRSQFFSFIPQLNTGAPCRARSPPLRVYMYDLPPRFNVGLMDSKFPNNTPVTAANIPGWRWNDGLRKQHSVEYWMMASLLYEGNDELTREAVRVTDPGSAEVFFVPFFSSLSFNVHVRNMAELNTVDEQLQREMVNILRASEYWKRSGGRDHVITMHHPNAFRQYRDEVNASIFIVADFGRIMNISRLAKDVVAPYPHMVESYISEDREDPYKSRKTLLFFRGRTKRKDEGKIRAQLQKLLDGMKDVIYEEGFASEEGFKASAEQMRSSKFCLHPAGDTPSSCRLFDAIVSHCIPVIVSDRLELPFESEIDYKEFSLFFSVNEALKPGYLVNELRAVSKAKWMKMWSRIKNISHHFEFQYPSKNEDAVNMIWREVKQKVPAVKLAVHRSRRLKIPDWWR